MSAGGPSPVREGDDGYVAEPFVTYSSSPSGVKCHSCGLPPTVKVRVQTANGAWALSNFPSHVRRPGVARRGATLRVHED